MADRVRWVLRLVSVLLVIGIALFVWPTRYRFDYTNIAGRRLVVRIDRLSGTPQVLTDEGWTTLQRAKGAAAPEKTPERRTQTLWDTEAIEGRAGISDYGDRGSWEASLYNGTEWTLTELTVHVAYKGCERTYRVPCHISPKSSGTLSAQVDSEVVIQREKAGYKSPDWYIEKAQGYPPRGYKSPWDAADDLARLRKEAAERKAAAREKAKQRRIRRITLYSVGGGVALLGAVAAIALVRRRRSGKLVSPIGNGTAE